MNEKIIGILVLGTIAVCALFAVDAPTAEKIVVPIVTGISGLITGAAMGYLAAKAGE